MPADKIYQIFYNLNLFVFFFYSSQSGTAHSTSNGVGYVVPVIGGESSVNQYTAHLSVITLNFIFLSFFFQF